MAIEIRETFQVAAPIEQVWSFMKSPENLAGCMPGASITQLIDERSFIGTVMLRVGAITASYDGTMSFIKLDESTREMTLLAGCQQRYARVAAASAAGEGRLDQRARGGLESDLGCDTRLFPAPAGTFLNHCA